MLKERLVVANKDPAVAELLSDEGRKFLSLRDGRMKVIFQSSGCCAMSDTQPPQSASELLDHLIETCLPMHETAIFNPGLHHNRQQLRSRRKTKRKHKFFIFANLREVKVGRINNIT